MKVDARAWVAWLVAAMALTMIARNPLYSLILLLVGQVVGAVWGRPNAGVPIPLWRIGLVILLFAIAYNALSVHIGETVLLRLPAGWPLIGGPITLEAAVYGLANGLVLFTLLALFATFNAVVTTSELVGLTPRAFRDLGIVVLIAITYLPETGRHFQRVRQAQAIRGHRLGGVRDWRPLLIPLLVGGLERAMGLAEAMVARGYGATADSPQSLRTRAGLAGGLALALAGWVWSFWAGWPGWLLLAGGVALVTGMLWRLGRQSPPHTRYRPQAWTGWEWLTLAAAVAPLPLILLPWADRATLTYSPYPALSLPGFDPIIGLALATLALPALAGLLFSQE